MPHIAIEIGNRKKGIINANLGAVFHSTAENQKAMEYCEKVLAIAIEIGNRQEEGTRNGNLGAVFESLG